MVEEQLLACSPLLDKGIDLNSILSVIGIDSVWVLDAFFCFNLVICFEPVLNDLPVTHRRRDLSVGSVVLVDTKVVPPVPVMS